MTQNQTMHIVFSTDANYAPHTGAAIRSLRRSNPDSALCVWILDNQIGEDHRNRFLRQQEEDANLEIRFVDFAPYARQLQLNMLWNISISSYARLFLPQMLPETVERALYLDCDTVVCGSLAELFRLELGDCLAAGVLDLSSDEVKVRIGLDTSVPYVNAGVLLFDLTRMRLEGTQQQFLDFLSHHNGQVYHHDQGVINGVLHDRMMILPQKYNVMTPLMTMKRSQIQRFYGLSEVFYPDDEILSAAAEPVIIHYTPCFSGRPWETGCSHPRKEIYLACKLESPWADVPLIAPRLNRVQILERWLYRNLPFGLVHSVLTFLFRIKEKRERL